MRTFDFCHSKCVCFFFIIFAVEFTLSNWLNFKKEVRMKKKEMKKQQHQPVTVSTNNKHVLPINDVVLFRSFSKKTNFSLLFSCSVSFIYTQLFRRWVSRNELHTYDTFCTLLSVVNVILLRFYLPVYLF